MTKILILDLESAPKVAYVWQFWKANVAPDQVVADGFLMTGAWKWLGDKEMFSITGKGNIGSDKHIVEALAAALDEADIIVAHNAKKFDIPLFNYRCIVNGVQPPSPYKVIDTLEVAKRKFKFDSNKLESIARVLGCAPKDKHKRFPGFLMWKECLAGNTDAWDDMLDYNEQDVTVLEEVYLKLRPWIDNHPNVNIMEEHEDVRCPKCGSKHVHYRGYAYTNHGKYHRIRCVNCGGWARTRFTLLDKRVGKNILANGGYQ